MDYSIVIPVYKSGEWIDVLVERIGATMESIAPANYELILVNDCSPDTVTWLAIKEIAKKYRWVRGFNLLYNVGQYRAIICGLHQARGRYVITMDDDLQHPPEELPKLINKICEDEDTLCVMGFYEKKKHNLFRNIGSKVYQSINRLYGIPYKIHTSSFRIIRKELGEALISYHTAKPHISALIVSLTDRIKNVKVRHESRCYGRSGYKAKELISITLENLVNASTIPLKVFSMIGLLCTGTSLVLACYFFIRWMKGEISVIGYTSQILLILFFGGTTLAGIGILGEYIARIISEITGPSTFHIKERTEKEI